MKEQETKTLQIPEGYMAKIDGNKIKFVKIAEPKMRVGYGGTYYFICDEGNVSCKSDYLSSEDNLRYKVGNYFIKEEKAEHAASAIKELLKNYHVNKE